jgi:radical SAM protein with 4Fe4S-binding SPASM domain
VHKVAAHGQLVVVDLMLLPEQVDDVATHMRSLRQALPADTRIAIGVLYHGGRELGQRVFRSRAELERALDQIAFEAGETIAAPRRSALADRREGCTCALGHHLHMRSDGGLFTCFKMEEKVGDLREARFSQVVEQVQALPKPASVLAMCRDCHLATLCGGGCRAENLQFTGQADVPVCGPWRVRVLSELLAEDCVTALEWPAVHLLEEARARGIEAPPPLQPLLPSRHLLDT